MAQSLDDRPADFSDILVLPYECRGSSEQGAPGTYGFLMRLVIGDLGNLA